MAKQPNKPKTPARTTAKAAPRTGSRTVVRRQERESERRRQRFITGGIIAVALIAAAVFIFVIVNSPAEAPIPETAVARYEGIPQSRTNEGYPWMGSPDARVQVAEYSSFDCPHCREFHDEAIQQIVDRVKSGAISFTYVPLYGFGAVTNGQGAAVAALCAADQNGFWAFHDTLFDWQGRFGNQAFTNNRILSGIDTLGLNRSTFNACVSSGTENEVLNTARAQQQSLLNFTGTPTVTINGVVPVDENQQPLQSAADIIARIDAEIARMSALPSTPEVSATAEATDEAVVEATEAAVVLTDEAEATPAS